MSLKRILGTALASRLGGRGRRRGSLSGTGLLGGSGYRRNSGLRGKGGIAALGFMAYRAYQDHQSRTAQQSASQGGSSSSSTGGIGGIVKDLANQLTGQGSDQDQTPDARSNATENELREDERAAENFSDEKALLLIRAMITAAYSDGAMSNEERQHIMREIEEGGADEGDRRTMEREIATPKPLDDLLADVNDEETAEEFYLASRAAVDGETEANRAYLLNLRERLKLSDKQVGEIERLAA